MTNQTCPICKMNKARKAHKAVAARHSKMAQEKAQRGELPTEKPPKKDPRIIPIPTWYFTKNGHRREM